MPPIVTHVITEAAFTSDARGADAVLVQSLARLAAAARGPAQWHHRQVICLLIERDRSRGAAHSQPRVR
jgi:hypothetical protein